MTGRRDLLECGPKRSGGSCTLICEWFPPGLLWVAIKLGCSPAQGFYAAVDRETLQFWRITPSDLAELAAGRKLDGLAEGGVRSRSQQLPGGIAYNMTPGAIAPNAQAHVATSNAPVVNTLWKVRAVGIVGSSQILLCLPMISAAAHTAAWNIQSSPETPSAGLSNIPCQVLHREVQSSRWLTVHVSNRIVLWHCQEGSSEFLSTCTGFVAYAALPALDVQPLCFFVLQASPTSQVDIRAQAGGNQFASLMHTASGTVIA